MLAALYGHSLIETEEEEIIAGKKEPVRISQPFKYLGNNARKVCILVNDPETAFLPEDQLAFISKMLGACQMNIADVAIVNMASGNITFHDVVTELKPLKILAFGVTPDLTKLENSPGIEYLTVAGLSDLVNENDSSRALKGKLWSGLKEMFAIK